MRIVVLGAGHVGRAIVDALYEEHEITVIDTDPDRLTALADRYDVRTVEGNGTTKRVIREAVAPTPISTGEHTQNRILFKQFLQHRAIDVLQIDATRVGGVNENLAVLLLARKFGVRVFPHAGGVGLCELVQHLAMADFVAISGELEDRSIEFVDHLHEHFVHPIQLRGGRYLAPSAPGFSAELLPQSLAQYQFPDGPAWQQS